MIFRQSPFRPLQEHRLVFLEDKKREEVLEDAEQTQGTMEKTGADPLRQFRQNTEDLQKKIRDYKPGFWRSLLKLGSSNAIKSNILKEVRKEAHARLKDAMQSVDNKITTRLRSAERKIFLQEIEKQILADLRTYLESERQELLEKKKKYGRWARLLGASSDIIELGDLQSNEKILNLMGQAQAEVEDRSFGVVPDRFVNNEQTEVVLREQLIDLGIVKPDEFDDLLDRHFRGENDLIDMVRGATELNKNNLLRNALVRSLENMRKKGDRGYRVLKEAAQADLNVLSVDEKIRHLKGKVYPGFPITFDLNGGNVRTRVLRIQGEALILRDQGDRKKYLVLDLGAKVVASRDSGGKIINTSITDKNMVLNPQ
ncbi:MAG: hypothetical protein ABIA92_06095 [Patescibacteria group bacterium]